MNATTNPGETIVAAANRFPVIDADRRAGKYRAGMADAALAETLITGVHAVAAHYGTRLETIYPLEAITDMPLVTSDGKPFGQGLCEALNAYCTPRAAGGRTLGITLGDDSRRCTISSYDARNLIERTASTLAGSATTWLQGAQV
ncbi:hypothetical protein [Paraburkholderia sp. GAS32]|uniref:hypothetical protein n=1 Tax=Paraburkholderia sp. GAS32 TaxID=3035129 RepID=UPI003D1BBB2F